MDLEPALRGVGVLCVAHENGHDTVAVKASDLAAPRLDDPAGGVQVGADDFGGCGAGEVAGEAGGVSQVCVEVDSVDLDRAIA
ncbi:hypothetical protein [Streptomyces sp. NPDC057686]|uniref:hypothetical protein n=1 Tax=Streptomyces sp. NPDC057686 TaxID=3346212 RepID=UPI003695D0DC